MEITETDKEIKKLWNDTGALSDEDHAFIVEVWKSLNDETQA